METEDVEKAAPADAIDEDDEEDGVGDGPAGSPTFKRCLEQVRLNESCFASWTLLLGEAEATRNPMLESVFGQFLANFPQLYGYWNKYARSVLARVAAEGGDARAAAEAACAVYERGVVATGGASVDLWVKYGEFLTRESGLPPARIRGVLERGAGASKYDPRSPSVYRVWGEYEESLGERVRLLRCYRAALGAARAADDDSIESRMAALERVTDLAENVDDWGPDAASCDDFLCACATENNRASKADKARAAFETRLTRPYFHSKPLGDDQLRAWRAYLHFEEGAAGDADRTRALYERCCVICANYPEFWCKYASWAEGDAGLAVLKRGIAHLKAAPDLRLLLALLREAKGDVDGSREVYENLTESVAPGLLEGIVAFAQFERRHGNLDEVVAIYKDALAKAPTVEVTSVVNAHLARFQHQILRDTNAARITLETAIRATPRDKELWVAYYTLEASSDDADAMHRVSLLFNTALNDDSALTRADQAALWDLYLQHVEDLGPDVNQVLRVREDHDAWKRKRAKTAA